MAFEAPRHRWRTDLANLRIDDAGMAIDALSADGVEIEMPIVGEYDLSKAVTCRSRESERTIHELDTIVVARVTGLYPWRHGMILLIDGAMATRAVLARRLIGAAAGRVQMLDVNEARGLAITRPARDRACENEQHG
jgi:hypothetical protein